MADNEPKDLKTIKDRSVHKDVLRGDSNEARNARLRQHLKNQATEIEFLIAPLNIPEVSDPVKLLLPSEREGFVYELTINRQSDSVTYVQLRESNPTEVMDTMNQTGTTFAIKYQNVPDFTVIEEHVFGDVLSTGNESVSIFSLSVAESQPFHMTTRFLFSKEFGVYVDLSADDRDPYSALMGPFKKITVNWGARRWDNKGKYYHNIVPAPDFAKRKDPPISPGPRTFELDSQYGSAIVKTDVKNGQILIQAIGQSKDEDMRDPLLEQLKSFSLPLSGYSEEKIVEVFEDQIQRIRRVLENSKQVESHKLQPPQ